MTNENLSTTYQKLTDIEHVLLRPGMYIGSTKFHKSDMYLLDEGKFKLYEVSYNPGFLKLFDEIISNSVDEHRRSGDLNKIDVTVNDNIVSIKDNGGIPVQMHAEHQEWIPEMIFSNLRAGRNFNDDEDRIVAGTNGVGATLTNIYSKKFTIRTADTKKSFEQIFENNMHKRNDPKIKKTKNHYTEIIYEPDLERFGMEKIDEITLDFMRKRVADIAACNAGLKLSFNGENYKYPVFREYCELYTDTVFFQRDKNWKVGLGLSENGFKHVSFVNSVETKEGGTHVDYIINQITTALREKIKKKYKVDVKPSELRNHMFLFVESTVYNSSFSSQTKERLITEPKDFGTSIEMTEKFIKFVFESEIVKSVLDWIERKKDAEEKRELRKLNKNLSKSKVANLIDAKAKFNREKCVLGIYEGQSALSAVRKFRDSQTIGAYPLRGKFRNVRELTNSKVIQNEEVKGLMGSIGLKLGEDPVNLRYGKILIYTDADPDGDGISALLINFFAKYWPELFEQGKIYKVMTPLVVAKKGKTVKEFYTNEEYKEWLNNEKNSSKWDLEYKKGLASLEDKEYKKIIEDPYIVKITLDDVYKDTLIAWFGHDSLERKQKILGRTVNENPLF